MEFTLTHPDSGIKDILVIFDGVPYEANSDHPWWDEIIRLCLEDDPRVLDLFPIRPVQKPSEEIPYEPEGEPESLWLPHSFELADDDDDEARAEAREVAYRRQIIEEGS